MKTRSIVCFLNALATLCLLHVPAAQGQMVEKWARRYNGPAQLDDIARGLAVDGSGNVVVTGYSLGGAPFNLADFYTAKYSATDGTLLWEKRYNGPDNKNDEASAVAIDGSGNVVVVGYSWDNISFQDYYTAKYAAADGSLLWSQRFSGAGADVATAVVVDALGNVIVTGHSDGAGYDIFTVKYGATDGMLLWDKRYDGPAGSHDSASAVTVDASGNVVVTGYSTGATGSADYYTAKYAAADGSLMWEKRYNNSNNNFNGSDVARDVVVDGSGNVIVTGASEAFGTAHDYYTAKYAAANGALLWEQRYNGPANSGDVACAMALDGSGNVLVC